MTRRARRIAARFVAIGLVALAVALIGNVGAAGADGPSTQLVARGWWWRAQESSLPVAVPAPPNVQPGQLEVQGNPADPKGTAYAAVRFAVNADHSATTLTLQVGDNGDTGGSSAVVLACRTGSAWTAADAGKWESAPTVDDKACVNGLRSSDGKSWTFAVKPLQVGGVVDVASIPGVDPTTTTTSTFSLVFNQPANDSLASEPGAPATVSTVSNLTPTPADGATAPASGASGGGSTFHPPAVTPVATGLPTDKLGETATSPSKQAATQPGLTNAIASATPAKERNKTLGYLVLALAAAVGVYAWREDNLAAVAAVAGAEPSEPAGLGRFSRPRQGQPPALT